MNDSFHQLLEEVQDGTVVGFLGSGSARPFPCRLGDHHLRALGQALSKSSTALHTVDLTDSLLVNGTDCDLDSLLLPLPLHIHSLVLDQNQVTQSMAVALGRFLAGPGANGGGLRTLSLKGCHIQDAHAVVIAAGLTLNSSLQNLSLNDNEISHEGAISFGNVIQYNKTLQKLNLGANRIGLEAGRRLLQALKLNTTMISLCLLENPMQGQPESATVYEAIGHHSLQNEKRTVGLRQSGRAEIDSEAEDDEDEGNIGSELSSMAGNSSTTSMDVMEAQEMDFSNHDYVCEFCDEVRPPHQDPGDWYVCLECDDRTTACPECVETRRLERCAICSGCHFCKDLVQCGNCHQSCCQKQCCNRNCDGGCRDCTSVRMGFMEPSMSPKCPTCEQTWCQDCRQGCEECLWGCQRVN